MDDDALLIEALAHLHATFVLESAVNRDRVRLGKRFRSAAIELRARTHHSEHVYVDYRLGAIGRALGLGEFLHDPL